MQPVKLRFVIAFPICFLLCIECLDSKSQGFAFAQAQATDSDQDSETAKSDQAAKLKSAVKIGEINVVLEPMVPTEKVRGIGWSPKGNSVELTENEGVLEGELQIGDHESIPVELKIDQSEKPGKGVLRIDLDRDGKFSTDEIKEASSSESRGKIWFSFKATIDLLAEGDSTRPYPISVWYVVDPSEETPEFVARWSRTGWHEGKFKINDVECTAVITDGNSDGLFSEKDAWGLGLSAKEAYSYKNSTSKMNKHAWLDSVAYRITDFDPQGGGMKIEAFDLGMTQAEDRERKDPYAADKKFARAENPVAFTSDFEAAMELAQKDDKRVLVDFVTTWCGPCRTMDQLVYTAKPVVDKSSEFVCVKLDGDEEKELNDKFKVKGYPTLILLDSDGTVIRTAVGYQSVKKLLEFVRE